MRGRHEGRTFTVRYRHIAFKNGQQEVICLETGALFICQAQSGEWRVSHSASGWMIPAFEFWDDAALLASLLADEDWAEADTDPAVRRRLLDKVEAAKAEVALYACANTALPQEERVQG